MPTARQRLLVIGSSGHARVVLDAIERAAAHQVIGLVDSFRAAGEEECGYRILGTEDRLPEIAREHRPAACFVAIGDNWQRHLAAQRVLERIPGLEFATVVHPSAQIARGASLGHGSVVLAGGIVNAGAHVGPFCIVNTAASLDHDAHMEEFSSLAPGARTGGYARVGAFTAIGMAASLLEQRRVGAHCVVGAGAVVLQDLPERCVAYGLPARPVRERAVGEPYL